MLSLMLHTGILSLGFRVILLDTLLHINPNNPGHKWS